MEQYIEKSAFSSKNRETKGEITINNVKSWDVSWSFQLFFVHLQYEKGLE